MKHPVLPLTTAVLVGGLSSPAVLGADDKTAPAESESITVDAAFATPESVEYDAAGDVYLVTNINGSPFAVDGNGFVSRINPDGSVESLKWIDGAGDKITLNAPKGAAIVGDTLYITDIDTVRLFGLPDGEPAGSVPIKGSTFLNGITPAGNDCAYVTDTGLEEGFKPSGTDAVYKVCADGDYETIVSDKDLGGPNGIVRDGERLVVVTFRSGEVLSIDGDGKVETIPAPPNGALDGVLKLDDGRVLVSSWDGSAVYALQDDGTYRILADGLVSPADMGLDTRRNRVLVPLFKKNKVVIVPL